jgi:hypothetical protein
MTRVTFAFDKRTARTFDADGRMRVRDCILSTAEVNPYYGREIPGWQGLGLKSEQQYDLYRDPDEMKKGAASFNGVPLMLKHIPQTADDPRKEYQAGSVHSVRFDGKHMRGDLLVSDGYAIDLIKSDQLSDLSCGYRYDPEMTSGDNAGARYDGIMRNIQGNHVALVDDGRASDAHVADAAFKPQPGASTMPNPVNPAAAPAPAAAAPAAAAPMAAAPGAEMGGQSDMAAIGAALKNIAELLADIHGKVGGAAPAAAAAPAAEPAPGADNMNGETDEIAQQPGEGEAQDFDLTAATEGNEGNFASGAQDEDEPGPEQSGEYSVNNTGSQEGTPARGNTTPQDMLGQGEPKGPAGAMDAKSVRTAIVNAVKAERARAAGVSEALREVRGVLGEVYGMDDAGAIYREALAQVGVDIKHVAKGTERAAWQACKVARGVQAGAGRRVGQQGDAQHALDAKAVETNQSNVVQMLGKIRVLG